MNQSASGGGTLWSLLASLKHIGELLAPLFATAAVVAFFYGIALLIFKSGDEETQKKAKSILVWSIIALFILVTLWGIIGFFEKTIGNTQGPPVVPIEVPILR